MDNLYWMQMSNFGDALNPYLYEKITGHKPTYTNNECGKTHYIAVGSILNHATENSIVWGAGLAWGNDNVDPKADIRAVRGPFSRDIAISSGCKCPEVYGDPALLMPKYYNPKLDKEYEIGIIPHVEDYQLLNGDHNVNVLDLSAPIETVIDELLKCERIVSSSLHGLIIADAYNIPSLWVEFSDRVLGDGTKFNDYFYSVGITPYAPMNLRNYSGCGDIMDIDIPRNDIQINLDKLMDACPFYS